MNETETLGAANHREKAGWRMHASSMKQAGGAPLALVAATLAVLVLIGWLAPAAGVANATREDTAGPPLFHPGSLEWPRTVTDFDHFAVRMERPPQRVISQFWSIDEFLFTGLPPERVVGVSETAYLESISNVYPHVTRLKPIVASDPERVIRTEPDLIFVASSARADFTALARSTGVPVYRLATTFITLDQIASTIRLIGYLTGEDIRAEQEEKRFLDAVATARTSRPAGTAPPRVLGFGGRFSYGDKTLFDDVIRTVGGVNVGAEGGLHGYSPVSSEQILRWDPEWIVIGAEAGKEERTRQRLLDDPALALTRAVRAGRIIVYDQRVFLPLSPFVRQLLEALPRDLYGS